MNARSGEYKSLYLLLALALSIAMGIFSGWRDIGSDRENYILMYNGIINNEEWFVKFWYAKDVFFLVATIFSNYFSEDPRLTFLIICFFSALLKYYSVKKMAPKGTLAFVFLYGIFLAPGLEFAAMRGALAIGFLMLAIAYRDEKYKFSLFSILAILSHLAIIPAVIFAIDRINKFLASHKSSYIVISIGTLIMTPFLLNIFPHGVDYENNKGTLFSYSEPITTFIIAWLIFYGNGTGSSLMTVNSASKYFKTVRPIAYGLISLAFGITGGVVIAGTRYLEVVWCLLLFVFCANKSKKLLNLIGGLLLICLFVYVNTIRMTWNFIFI
jgi:hypothetical protein